MKKALPCPESFFYAARKGEYLEKSYLHVGEK